VIGETQIRQRLLDRLAALRGRSARDLEALGEHDSGGDLADAAAQIEHSELLAHGVSVDADEIERIQAALERLERGEYGTCVGCAEPIPAARLDALPAALRCVPCEISLTQPDRATRAHAEPPNLRPPTYPMGPTPSGGGSAGTQ
jgi:DnaK suppressor protein